MKPLNRRSVFDSSLRVILGGLHPERLASIAWMFARTALWNHFLYSEKEKLETIRYIQLWLESRNPRQRLLQFIQRILLARQSLHRFRPESLALPSFFFDPENADGFSLTGEWWLDVKIMRESLPIYKKELKVLADAIILFSSHPTAKSFRYWKTYFIERDEPVLLNLFMLYCANFHFNKA